MFYVFPTSPFKKGKNCSVGQWTVLVDPINTKQKGSLCLWPLELASWSKTSRVSKGKVSPRGQSLSGLAKLGHSRGRFDIKGEKPRPQAWSCPSAGSRRLDSWEWLSSGERTQHQSLSQVSGPSEMAADLGRGLQRLCAAGLGLPG